MYHRHYLEVRYIVGFMVDSDRLSCLLSRTMSAIERPVEHFRYDVIMEIAQKGAQ